LLKGESSFMTVVAYALVAFIAAQAPNAPAARPVFVEPTLDQVRAATERFRDVKVALAEGYVRDPMDHCVVAPDIGRPAADGAMGVHYIRMDLIGVSGPPNPRVSGTGTHTDFTKPAILLYEPQADGSLELVGVENLVFKSAWAAAGNMHPPAFQGVTWNSMEDDPTTPIDEGHMFTPHYDRHVWLYRENPKGIYEQFNASVSCAAHKADQSAPAAQEAVSQSQEKPHKH
jgi:hypothetical protein